MYQAVEWWGNIPETMRAYPRFMVCGKDKAPLDARTGYRTGKDDPAKWLNFGDACYFAEENDWLIGYVPRPDCPFVIIDIDNKPGRTYSNEAIEVRNNLLNWAVENTYVERSISGNGYHIVVEGTLAHDFNNASAGIEAYCNMGFVVLTGNCISKTTTVSSDNGLCAWLSEQYKPETTVESDTLLNLDAITNPSQHDTWQDDNLLATMGTWHNAANISRWFYAQDLSAENGYGGGSEGDLKLMQTFLKFAPHTDKESAAVRMFMKSQRWLLRRHRKTDWVQYLGRTLARAKLCLAQDAQREAQNRVDPEMVEKFFQQSMAWQEERAKVQSDFALAKATGQLSQTAIAPPLPIDPNPFKFFTASELKARQPLEWALKGIFPVKGMGAIWGDSGAGKSFVAIDLMVALAKGDKWFGLRTKQSKVACLALEGAGGLRQRVMAWEKAHNDEQFPESVMFFDGNFELTKNDHLGYLCTALNNGHGTFDGVVIIDTLNQASGGVDENSSRDMGELIKGIRVIMERTNSLVIVVHHGTKAKETQTMRGHSSFQAACDGIIEVSRTEDEDIRKWLVTKSKDGDDSIAREFEFPRIDLGFDDHNEMMTSRAIRPRMVADVDKGTGEIVQQFSVPEKRKVSSSKAQKVPTWSAEEYAPYGGATSKKKAREYTADDGSKYDWFELIRNAITIDANKTKNANMGKHGAPPDRYAIPRKELVNLLYDLANPDDGITQPIKKAVMNALNYGKSSGKLGRVTENGEQWFWLV